MIKTAAILLTIIPCTSFAAKVPEHHLINNLAFRTKVETQFAAQKLLAKGREKALFAVFDQPLTLEEREALQFLFAFSPLSDLADYDGEYFLRMVRVTLEARRTMPWAGKIPEDAFLHYVLPFRVNNENLDDGRLVIFVELKDRVRGLTLSNAVLEVNRWCHEKVTYRPSDERTSAPLATIRTTWGRCGEESTLTVTALRAVGIPARQVYTPRWAHVDDNHAWVEAWVDGKWHYLGACEPAPSLDMAWFTEPVKRAMMVHAKVIGGATGGAEKIQSTPWFDEINVLSTYAPTLRRVVKVVDGSGKIVTKASVIFGLYNYSEFYPLARKQTGADGRAVLVTGKGDLLITARKGDQVGYRLIGPTNEETVIVIGSFNPYERIETLDVHPPIEPFLQPSSTSRAAREDNEKACLARDGQRQAIMATFMDAAKAEQLASELAVDPKTLTDLTPRIYGNGKEISSFLRQTQPTWRDWAVSLLGTISDKDLRDTPESVLRDHLEYGFAAPSALMSSNRQLFINSVLNPRIANEILTPWRGYLQRVFDPQFFVAARQDPGLVVKWVKDNITLNDEANYYRVPITPRGVYELKVADTLSRDILLVAIFRSAGIAARLEPATRAPQVFTADAWKTITYDEAAPITPPSGQLVLAKTGDFEGAYATSFAIAKYQDGEYRTLNFEGKPWSSFQQPVPLPIGWYALTTGNRLDDGSVLVNRRYFEIKTGENKKVTVVIRQPKEPPVVLGRVPLDAQVITVKDQQRVSLEKLLGQKGGVLAWLGPGEEPTEHALGELERLREVFEKWEGGLVLILVRDSQQGANHVDRTRDLPRQTVVAVDLNGELLTEISRIIKRLPVGEKPVVIAMSPKGEVIFYSQGYRIGVGEQVLKTIRRLQNQQQTSP